MKLKFFENIYYWLWRCVPKFKGAHTPPARASTLVSIFKGLNVFFMGILLSAIFKQNLLLHFFGTSRHIIIIGSLILGFSFVWNDEKKYMNRHEDILSKVDALSSESKRNKLIMFIIYTILSIGVWTLVPTLQSYY